MNELANYRHKRVMGLAGIFGDHLLSSEKRVICVISIIVYELVSLFILVCSVLFSVMCLSPHLPIL